MRPKILTSFCCPFRGSDNANISFNMPVVSSVGGNFVIGILTYMFGGNDEGPLMKVVNSCLGTEVLFLLELIRHIER